MNVCVARTERTDGRRERRMHVRRWAARARVPNVRVQCTARTRINHARFLMDDAFFRTCAPGARCASTVYGALESTHNGFSSPQPTRKSQSGVATRTRARFVAVALLSMRSTCSCRCAAKRQAPTALAVSHRQAFTDPTLLSSSLDARHANVSGAIRVARPPRHLWRLKESSSLGRRDYEPHDRMDDPAA